MAERSAGMVSIGKINSLDAFYNGILVEMVKNPSIYDTYYGFSAEEAKAYLMKRCKALQSVIDYIEKYYDLKENDGSASVARENYLELKKYGSLVFRTYYEAICRLACVNMLLGNKDEAYNLLENCRSMNSRIDTVNILLAMLSLYDENRTNATAYFDDYLKNAPDYYEETQGGRISTNPLAEIVNANDKVSAEAGRALANGTFDADDIKNASEEVKRQSNYYDNSLAGRLSLVVTLCKYDGYDDLAEAYLAIMESHGYVFDEMLLNVMRSFSEESYRLSRNSH